MTVQRTELHDILVLVMSSFYLFTKPAAVYLKVQNVTVVEMKGICIETPTGCLD